MTAFYQYFLARLELGGFSTEDTLTSFLPLVGEVLEAHAAGRVAPLEGLDALHVEGARIWFEESRRMEPKKSPVSVGRIENAHRAALEIVSAIRQVTDVSDGQTNLVDLAIGDLESDITQPVYLPDYVAWEHRVGHHDPLTDIFSLGMILASLSCGLDFHDPASLKRFIAGRRNLFAIQPGLHPVLAQAICRMTELDRHRRVQDLQPLLHSLENYRHQDVDFEFDLAQEEGFVQKDSRSKQHVVLNKLKERLFELSRRNRLLHFRPTMHTVNLTHASVPLSFDIRSIRPDQILVWNDSLHRDLAGGKSISLNRHLNFAEALYLPGTLDRVIAEARRDRAEFGFAQLRLVICFLHWANLKENPVERFESPLLLLPVELKKKKGIRDTYTMQAPSPEAEVNPVVRHQFKRLYDIELPQQLDLFTTDLDHFFKFLSARIEASEPAVTLSKIDRPRIELVYDKAKRNLDQYHRRARLAGRGVRNFMDLDYSYDPATYHPLGIKLFTAMIRPPGTHLRSIIEEKPRPRTFAVPSDGPVAEKEKVFFSLQSGAEDNPYAWGFDLCSMTLGNFKYRKMSLVRDYEALLRDEPANPGFEATFSLVPRPVDRRLPPTPPLTDRYDVVPCDPTQASAIEEAHAATSYIIQGPPGTGKSQTITNLIADYAARGKRVLFVCEKRAAIDVVYARLRQCGLEELCCIIHDSQTDKKSFVMELKHTYESIIEEWDGKKPRAGRKRSSLLKELESELAPLERFDAAMQHTPPEAAIPLRQLLDRCIRLQSLRTELSPLERERLPQYATWWQHREAIDAFAKSVENLCSEGILANHPLAFFSPRLAHEERPLQLLSESFKIIEAAFRQLEDTLGRCGIPREQWGTIARARALADYFRRALPVAKAHLFHLLDGEDPRSSEFEAALKQMGLAQDAVAEAQRATQHWRSKLPVEELPRALEQARSLEGKRFRWLLPAWWRMRATLRRHYDFQSHVVRPTWVQVLSALEEQYARQADLERQRKTIAGAFAIQGEVDELAAAFTGLQQALPRMPDWIAPIHASLLRNREAAETLVPGAAAGDVLETLTGALGRIADTDEDRTLDALQTGLNQAMAATDDLQKFFHCLEAIAGFPEPLNVALRTLPLTLLQIEAVVADRTLNDRLRIERDLGQFSEATRQRHATRLATLYEEWLESNALEIHDRVRRRFLTKLHRFNLPATQLEPDERETRNSYNRGRRELEREFGKSMRYKSIRDLVSSESGLIVRDLKPIWLMSPLSVSDTLPLDVTGFDVVIFDEASQITLEEAVPSLFRAGQAIVVGDEMQLPPTDFFSARHDGEEDEELLVEEQGELVRYDLESNSFLNHAAKNLPSTMLGWHYRSRSESLISFSNWAFYDGRLLTVPEEQLPPANRPAIRATTSSHGKSGAAELLERSISFHFMEHGVYAKRRNRPEADYIAHLVCELLRQQTGRSIGIVAFSEAQQDEIEGALARQAQSDAEFRMLLEAEQEREVDDQFVGLLVKNLENIQGDERDIIILSVCYACGPDGKMRMNFGPINKSGGEKRLNVAFSRAKQHMAVVSSIHFQDITNDYNDGANCLKNYLRYAEAVSGGDTGTVRRVLDGMSHWHDSPQDDGEALDPVAEQVAAALRQHGFVADRNVGQSHFRCDLAVRRSGDRAYRLGILIDNDAYYEQSDLLERDVMRPRLLRAFGWKTTFVLAKDWYDDSASVLDSLLHLLEDCPPHDSCNGLSPTS